MTRRAIRVIIIICFLYIQIEDHIINLQQIDIYLSCSWAIWDLDQ